MQAWFIISYLLLSGYCILILTYFLGWLLIPVFKRAASVQPINKFTVLIPARNEEASIIACLQSITSQDYPPHLFEVIILNDHSSDSTASLVQAYKTDCRQ